MKTVKEKAEKWGKDYPKLPLSELPYTDSDIEAVAMNSYLQGATCQQDIDINKAKQFASKWFDEIADLWLPALKADPTTHRRWSPYLSNLKKQ